jgi:GPH family glycoside/pentoside/hexuronide:cation symporter
VATPSALPLPTRQLLAYGALGLPLAMAALPVYVHVPRLYAEAAGMSLSLLGALLLAARLLDAGIDPLLGGWSDRTSSRRRLIGLALPCLALGMLALLHPPTVAAPLWLLASLVLTYFGFSLASVAYQAWGAELGRDAGERTRLTASREGFGLIGVILAAALPGLLANDLAQGLSGLAQIFPLLLLLLASWTFLGSPPSVARPQASGNLFGDLRAVLNDRRFRRLLTVFVVNGVAAALPATLVLFFVADVLQAEAWSGAFGPVLRQRRRLSAAVGDACQALRPRYQLGGRHVRRCHLFRLGLGARCRRRLALCRRLSALGCGAGR